jgi:hypothetical protein
MVMTTMVMTIPIAMVATIAMDRVHIPVVARFDQDVAAMVVVMVMPRNHDHLAVMMMVVVMPVAGFNDDRLGAGGTGEEQCSNPCKQ